MNDKSVFRPPLIISLPFWAGIIAIWWVVRAGR